MSESGSELVGIARSIDAFFTAAAQGASAPAAVDPPSLPETASAPAPEPPPLPDLTEASASAAAESEISVGAIGDDPFGSADALDAVEAALPSMAAAAAEVTAPDGAPAADLGPSDVASEPKSAFDVLAEPSDAEDAGFDPPTESVDSFDDTTIEIDQETFDLPEAAAASGMVEATEPEPTASDAAEPLPADDGAAAPEADDEAPTPLQAAVAAYLAGDTSAADDVRSLAAAEVESIRFDPVAEAAETLSMSDQPDAHALGEELMTDPVRARMVDRLGFERVEERREAYHAVFIRLGAEMAELLGAALAESTDRFARRVYFHALAAMGELARPTIVSMATDANGYLARNGIALLVELGGEGAEELIVAGIEHREPLVRRESLLGMARIKAAGADKRVLRALSEDDERVLEAAITAAGQLKIERAVTPLAKMLDQATSHDDIILLLHALGQIGDPAAVPHVEKHAAAGLRWKRRTAVRIAAFKALHHIGTPHAMELVKKAASDKDPEVQDAVLGLARAVKPEPEPE